MKETLALKQYELRMTIWSGPLQHEMLHRFIAKYFLLRKQVNEFDFHCDAISRLINIQIPSISHMHHHRSHHK